MEPPKPRAKSKDGSPRRKKAETEETAVPAGSERERLNARLLAKRRLDPAKARADADAARNARLWADLDAKVKSDRAELAHFFAHPKADLKAFFDETRSYLATIAAVGSPAKVEARRDEFLKAGDIASAIELTYHLGYLDALFEADDENRERLNQRYVQETRETSDAASTRRVGKIGKTRREVRAALNQWIAKNPSSVPASKEVCSLIPSRLKSLRLQERYRKAADREIREWMKAKARR
jgi:hypothetical protein